MASYIYDVYDNDKRLLGTFNDITNDTVFVEAFFYKYKLEKFSLTIRQVNAKAKTAIY